MQIDEKFFSEDESILAGFGLPTEADCLKMYNRFTKWQQLKELKQTSTFDLANPYILVNSVKNEKKLVIYYMTALLIGWTEARKAFAEKFKKGGIEKSEIDTIHNLIRDNLVELTALADKYKVNDSFGTEVKEGLEESSESREIEEDIEKHETLNPLIWNEDKTLKSEVKDKIDEIVNKFLSGFEEDGIKLFLNDIIIVGSNANYNYSKDSDLDIHLRANMEGLDDPEALYKKIYNSYRALFSNKYDISFYGIPVELYVETNDVPLNSNGIYSVMQGKWLKEPTLESIPVYSIDEINAEVEKLVDKYDTIVSQPISKISPEEVNNFIQEIYDKRKTGLSPEGSTGSEWAAGNLIFKEFRNRGYLDRLKDLHKNVISYQLSLNSEVEAEEEPKISEEDDVDIRVF